ncbi:MBL fold metallo-hydrolase [Pseudidiomarina sp.]|uniref:MBL fold metallo-hydrolase n=1 Tax=Pseudidiomarina sp. TaxID=2081707 RepID=UPI00299E3CD5|nr:MBL fold metallo-hydrolase [Pseudidiomarina sp.]MDX1705847.1 MBL fold metallo-hydrolase [Pseudidiomarina sp.]
MRNIKIWLAALTVLSLTAGLSAAAQAQSRFDDVEIKAVQLSDRVYMLTGAGGNIGVYLGDDSVYMVDAQYAPLAEKISAAIGSLTEQQLTTLINTHFHGDHTDGNAAFARQGVTVIAQHNVAARLAQNADFDKAGIPSVTFGESLQLNTGDAALRLQHYPRGHTDGDVVVWFADTNVIHAGDLFFVDRFPFIDLNAGGSVQGYIDNVSAVIAQLDDNTKIIPGHGGLSDKDDWQRLISMIAITREEVRLMQVEGLTVEQAVARGLSDRWADWSWGFITEERWIKTLYQDM